MVTAGTDLRPSEGTVNELQHPQGEEGMVETTLLEPSIPHGGALAPHLLTNRPFLWLVLGAGVAGLAFWAFLAVIFAEASFTFHADQRQMALLGLSLSFPFALFVPLQGIMVDRWSPKWLNLGGYLVLAAAIPFAWGAHSMTSLYVSSFLVGVAFATVEPARSALVGLLIDEQHLVKANGMMWVSFQSSLMIGNLVGGILLDAASPAAVYATALVVSVVALGFNLLVPDVRQGGERPALSLRDLRQGLRTSWEHAELRLLLVATSVGWLMVTTFFVLEPLFIKQTLRQEESAVAYLWLAHGAGAMLGAIVVARLKDSTGRELRLAGGGIVGTAAGLLLYVGVGRYVVAFAGAAFMGGGFSFIFAPGLALIQRVAGEEQRGRVTSIFGSAQESMGIVSAVTVMLLGPLVVVRPTLVAAAVVLLLTGVVAVRAQAHLRARLPVGRGAHAADDQSA